MSNKNKTKLWILGVIVVVALIVVVVWLRRAAAPAVESPVSSGFDLDTYLRIVATAAAQGEFDNDAHTNALHQVGLAHHNNQADMAQTHAARSKRERELIAADEACAELASARDELRQKLAALKATTDDSDDWRASVRPLPGQAELEGELAAAEAKLQEFFAADADWQKLNELYVAADSRRLESKKRLDTVIRARMLAQAQISQTQQTAVTAPVATPDRNQNSSLPEAQERERTP